LMGLLCFMVPIQCLILRQHWALCLKTWQNPLFFTGSITDRDLRTAKENLITAIQIASLQENGLPLLLRCAFILNISCIEETERPRSMRNILRHSSPIILLWSNLGFI
jgi:hypothetical protein